MVNLTTLPDGHSLEVLAAASWQRMGRERGHDLDIPLPLGAFRTYEDQAELYEAYLNGTGAYALPPGTSVHEQGRAADAGTSREYLAKHGGRHGWRRTNPDEAWHYEYDPADDLYAGQDPYPLQEDDDMPKMIQRNNANGTVVLITGAHYSKSLGKSAVEAWARVLGAAPEVKSAAEFDALLAPLAPVAEEES